MDEAKNQIWNIRKKKQPFKTTRKKKNPKKIGGIRELKGNGTNIVKIIY